MLRGRPHGDNIVTVRPFSLTGRVPPSASATGCNSSNGGDVPVMEAGTSLPALVRAAARRRPDAPAVIAGEERLSWGQLDAAVDRAAAGYAALGLRPGDRAAIQLPNGVRWLCAALGALRVGLIVVPVNTAYTDRNSSTSSPTRAPSSSSPTPTGPRSPASGSARVRPTPTARRRRWRRTATPWPSSPTRAVPPVGRGVRCSPSPPCGPTRSSAWP